MAGGLLAVAAVMLLVPVPELAIVLTLGSLRVWAMRFGWAARWHDALQRRWQRAAQRWYRAPRWLRWPLMAVAALIAATIVWWLLAAW